MKNSILLLIPVLLSGSYQNFKWEFDGESNDVIKRYRSQQKIDGQTPFKAKMIMDVHYTRVLMAIANNAKGPDWSPRLKKSVIHKQFPPLKYIYSQFYRAPWPLRNRQLLMEGVIKRKNNAIVFVAKGTYDKRYQHFRDDDYIQAKVYLLHFSLIPRGNRSEVTIAFVGNMGGWIPSWIINIVQKSWPANFLKSLNTYSKSEKNVVSFNYRNIAKVLKIPIK